MFVPDSTVEDLEHNLLFLQKNRLLDGLDRTANLLSHCQIVLLGTSGYNRFLEQGRLRPSGLFGFEGEVAFRDSGVAWLADLTVHACHLVLREMGKKDSPLYWQLDAKSPAQECVNDYLVQLFERLLQTVKSEVLPMPGTIKSEISGELRGILR